MVSGKIYLVSQNLKNKIGYIYKISDNNNIKNYYGSTIKNLNCRFSNHKSNYISKQSKKSKTVVNEIFDEFGTDNCKIELIEIYTYNDIKELRKREGLYIKNNECINERIPGRTNKERYEDNKEHIKKRYQDNKEHIKNYLKEWRKKNKEKNKEKTT